MFKRTNGFLIFLTLALITACGTKPSSSGGSGNSEEFPFTGPVDTTLSIVPTPEFSQIDEPVTFTAVLEPQPILPHNPPKGSVSFTMNGNVICPSVPLDSTFLTAVCTHTFPVSGNYEITAIYGEDTDTYKSSMATITYGVHKIPTTVSVENIITPVHLGDPLTLKVTVKGGTNDTHPLNGKLEVLDKAGSTTQTIPCGTFQPSSRKSTLRGAQSYSTTCSIDHVTGGGDHTILLNYLGDEYHDPSPTVTTGFTIVSGLTLSSDKTSAIVGDKIKLTANLNWEALTGTQTLKQNQNAESPQVAFKVKVNNSGTENDIVGCSAVPVANHLATCAFDTNLEAGNAKNYTLVAYYPANVASATRSNEINITLAPRTPIISITSAKEAGKQLSYVITANLASNSPSELPLPTGTAAFYVDGAEATNCGNANVNNGMVACTIDFHKSKNHITVKYISGNNSLYSNTNYEGDIILSGFPQPDVSLKENEVTNAMTYSYDASGQFLVYLSGNWADIPATSYNSKLILNNVIVTKDYLLKKENDEIPITQNSECVNTRGNNVFVCTYSPLVTNFKLNYTLTYQNGTIQDSKSGSFVITITPSEKSVTLTDDTTKLPGCGLKGSTEERMFDCSMLVKNSSGYAQFKGTDNPTNPRKTDYDFVPSTNVDENWFLVSCPLDSPSSKCSWLSPVLKPDNPVLTSDEYLSWDPRNTTVPPNLPTANGEMNYYKNGRILWSGIQLEGGNSFQTVNPVVYWLYPRPQPSDQHIPWNIRYYFQSGKSVSDYTSNYGNVCENSNKPDLQGNVYEWRVPSYPQLMTLTGALQCDSTQGVRWDECLMDQNHTSTSKRLGFAASIVPGFSRPGASWRYWGSSVTANDASTAWSFDSTTGKLTENPTGTGISLRCASMKW